MKTAVSIPLALAVAVVTAACMPESRPDEPAYASPAGAEPAATTGTGQAVPTTSPDPPEEPSRYKIQRIHMEELDDNKDGYITPDELPADHVLGRNFETYDTNADGRISEAEFFDYIDANTME